MDTNARGSVRVEPGKKRVRAYLAGRLVADTRHPSLVWEIPYYPAYYVPLGDVTAELVPTGKTEHSPSRGEADLYDVRVDGQVAEGAASRYPDSPLTAIRDLIRFDWAAMDEWMEEDEPVYTHPRDPYHRVDILHSSRHVRVEVDGMTVADSVRPVILFETGLPPRYYLPLSDLRTELLTPTDTQTHCPYKGTASYWTVDTGHGTHADLIWAYRMPLPESQKIAGLACFYDEKVDVYLDGELQDRPRTHFA
ncbi:DUF427 domain-containing protein [Trebonia kvetii]|uniref:DUF427 domain-containing protein n=1 Tax=Trebonia kvetii TaxID=2480626 RepID=A0A6P2C3S6_9ACTN|nr:DUF427 domain-containing protein [Trebonia kvetii]TVZ05145.1 DUF427 domain-containing protein [Trebonia kvetii]